MILLFEIKSFNYKAVSYQNDQNDCGDEPPYKPMVDLTDTIKDGTDVRDSHSN